MRLPKRKNMRRQFMRAMVGTGVLSYIVVQTGGCAQAATEGSNNMESNNFTQRGKQLRLEIEERYKKLTDDRALKSSRPSDITDVVVKYIPVGTSFDDAENILRAAGFRVDSRPSANPTGNRPGKHDVVGAISP